uniref:Hydrogenase maturation protein, carbamoyl dehydratase HypE n=1 Tax=Candidatus Kentrum sp. TUN TaxID=2126343 RepID=A0A451A715_9GAMM|nr:MAG: Hydrogenase maturation protein, carbamoyl dehydratase HypE [Candidatus Kentron sp. TUN]VFK63506.1 MAG: Hydrogenase maturation protein, carbamoyl dehydratase HypE [Candidatus Kentron sp. TUN]VFK70600.1 MAG: Hydrogenase maturation protein, carbamoyl dehydratase HypE [Candidatus Kentron sp. TUN]
MQDTHISLAHGNGGRRMRELIEAVFARHLGNPDLDTESDAVSLFLPKSAIPSGEIMVTTDGFTVQPPVFPGGDIGSLAIHGTANDLAVAGATPLYFTLSAFIEEGFPMGQLEDIVASMAEAAREIGARVVAGDTKVVRRGEGGGVYFAMTGIGVRVRPSQVTNIPSKVRLGLGRIQVGDAVLVSGPVGDHGIAVLLAREEFGLQGDLQSDTAHVLPITRALLPLAGLRFMRDPTRGGLATVAHEICRGTGFGVRLRQSAVPVRDSVRTVCEILGYDPLYLACEGRVVMVVATDAADEALAICRATKGGREAAIVGTVQGTTQQVIVETEFGGERILEELEDDPLPRIC